MGIARVDSFSVSKKDTVTRNGNVVNRENHSVNCVGGVRCKFTGDSTGGGLRNAKQEVGDEAGILHQGKCRQSAVIGHYCSGIIILIDEESGL